jgi:hypothetical protein
MDKSQMESMKVTIRWNHPIRTELASCQRAEGDRLVVYDADPLTLHVNINLHTEKI